MTRYPATDSARHKQQSGSRPRRLAAMLSSAVLIGGLASSSAALEIKSNTSGRGGGVFSETTVSLFGISLDLYHNDYGRLGRSYAARFLIGRRGTSLSYSNLDQDLVLGLNLLSYSYLLQAKKGPSGYELSSSTW